MRNELVRYTCNEGECYFCFEWCYYEDFCEGCQEFVCAKCVGGADNSYRHDVEEHRGGYAYPDAE